MVATNPAHGVAEVRTFSRHSGGGRWDSDLKKKGLRPGTGEGEGGRGQGEDQAGRWKSHTKS